MKSYTEIRDRCLAENILYEDEDFPACHTSIDSDEMYKIEEDCLWKRPKVCELLLRPLLLLLLHHLLLPLPPTLPEDFPACHTSIDSDEMYKIEEDCLWKRPKVCELLLRSLLLLLLHLLLLHIPHTLPDDFTA